MNKKISHNLVKKFMSLLEATVINENMSFCRFVILNLKRFKHLTWVGSHWRLVIKRKTESFVMNISTSSWSFNKNLSFIQFWKKGHFGNNSSQCVDLFNANISHHFDRITKYFIRFGAGKKRELKSCAAIAFKQKQTAPTIPNHCSICSIEL